MESWPPRQGKAQWEVSALNLTNHHTRDAILTALKVEGPLRVDAVAERLGVSKMAARQQLSELTAAGLITVSLVRSTVGRPAHVYQLSPRGDALFPRTYADFTLDLLDRLADKKGVACVENLMAARWTAFTHRHLADFEPLPLAERVQALADIQTEHGFMATVKDHGGFLELTEHNCSIQSIASRYPQFCGHELSAFCTLLGGRVERTTCIAEGDRCCRYVVRPD